MKKATDPRHLARILALQGLFSKDFNPGNFPLEGIPVEELASMDEIEKYNTELYNNILNGVPEQKEDIDTLITQHAPQWPIEQMKLVDLQILRMAIFEGFTGKITPPKVAIDEAIEVAREFGGETSSKFVNGVLGAIYEEIKAKTEQNGKSNLEKLEQILGVTFKDTDYLKTAITHRSFLNEHKEEVLDHNERLEFLGDAVLELIISDYLFNKYPEYPEGDLTSFRSAIVRTESLAIASRELQVGKFLRMSKGEEESGGADKDYLLANTYESLLGAIYMDQGYDEAKGFVFNTLVPKIEDIVKNRSDIDSKTKIQELVQSKFKVTPTYDVINEEGPDHDKKFIVGVKINNNVIGEGEGPSKQKAEEDAATNGIKFLLNKYNDLE